MKFILHPLYYEIKNGKKIKYSNKKIKKINYVNENEFVKKSIEFKKNKNIKKFFYLNHPAFWCKTFSDCPNDIKNEFEKINLKIDIEKNHIMINDIQYPSISDENKLNELYHFTGNDFFVNQLFDDFIPFFSNKKINFISSFTTKKINRITQKFPGDVVKHLFKNHIYSQYELHYGLGDNKLDFQLLPSRIISEIENKKLHQYTKDIKFNLGFLFIRKSIKDSHYEKNMFVKLLKLSQFVFERADKNGCFIFHYVNGLSSSFINYVFYISQFFKKIKIFKFLYKQDIGLNIWIKCYGFIPKNYNSYKKQNYLDNISEDVLEKIKLWNTSNIQTKLNEYHQTHILQKIYMKNYKLDFDKIIQKVKSFLLINQLPINIVYNDILIPYNSINKNDMNHFLIHLYSNPNIQSIFEYEPQNKNWLLCSALWNQQNENIEKHVNYYFTYNFKEESDIYLTISSFKINIYNNIDINKINNQNIFSIIDNNLSNDVLYQILNHSYICMINKNVQLPHLDYYLVDSSENYYFLKKNQIKL